MDPDSIALFPKSSSTKDIIRGMTYFNKGRMQDKRKFMQKAASLGHKNAIAWIALNRKKNTLVDKLQNLYIWFTEEVIYEQITVIWVSDNCMPEMRTLY